MAAILHGIYGSFDLVMQGLRVHNGRMQTSLSQTYFQRITSRA